MSQFFQGFTRKHGTSGTCKSKRILSDKSRGIIVVLKHDDRRRQERSQTILLQNSDGKIKGIHAQITGNPQTRFTIEELSSMYEIPLTTMKNASKMFMEILFILIRRGTA